MFLSFNSVSVTHLVLTEICIAIVVMECTRKTLSLEDSVT